MAKSQMGEFIGRLGRTVLLHDGAGPTDGQLLEEHLDRPDGAALAALVRRHGPMVWGVCRRILPSDHDAEDAFQAAFLVFVRKAASIASKELLANWLYGVARQTALKARATAARRRTRERQVTEMPDPIKEEQGPWSDLLPLLDDELSRLPEKYRAVIVLCELEGKTRKDVAKAFGLPEGTVASRLATARAMLAKRLTRHRLVVSGGALVTMLSDRTGAAAVPPAVLASTIRATNLVATGRAAVRGVVSPNVAALTEGVLKSMLLNRLKPTLAVLMLAAVVAAGNVAAALPGPGSEPPRPAPAEEPKARVDPVIVRDGAVVNRLVYSADGRTVATVGVTYAAVQPDGADEKAPAPNSTIKLWDPKTGKLKRSLGEEKGLFITALSLSPDGKTAALVAHKYTDADGKPMNGSTGTEVRLLETETWGSKRDAGSTGLETLLTQNTARVSHVAFSPDGKRLALGGSTLLVEGGGFLKLWDLEKKTLIGGTKETRAADELGSEDFKEQVTALAFSPDGKLLAAGCADGKMRLFDGRTGGLKTAWGEDTARANWLAFFPDGKTLLSESADKSLKVWDVDSGKVLRVLKGNKAWVTAVAFSPDGTLLATGGRVTGDQKGKLGEVLLWDAKTGELKRAVADLTAPVFTLAFSPDGRTLAVGGGEVGDVKDGGKTTGEIRFVPLESLTTGRK